MAQYTAANLSDIAAMFDLCAWQATAFSDRLHKTQRARLLAEREAATWKRAAEMLRNTTLTVETAARAIVHQRDYFAEHGMYDCTTFLPDEDQQFDDWAADILSQALDTTATQQ